MVGITAWGAYAPRLRLSRKAVTAANAWIAPNLVGKGKGERAMANWDEDALTMAVEAARDVTPAATAEPAMLRPVPSPAALPAAAAADAPPSPAAPLVACAPLAPAAASPKALASRGFTQGRDSRSAAARAQQPL